MLPAVSPDSAHNRRPSFRVQPAPGTLQHQCPLTRPSPTLRVLSNVPWRWTYNFTITTTPPEQTPHTALICISNFHLSPSVQWCDQQVQRVIPDTAVLDHPGQTGFLGQLHWAYDHEPGSLQNVTIVSTQTLQHYGNQQFADFPIFHYTPSPTPIPPQKPWNCM